MNEFPRIYRPQEDDMADAAPRDDDVQVLPRRWMTPWRPLDLVVFYGREWQSRVIEQFTRGPSHIGIILLVGGHPLLYESTTLCPLACELAHMRINGVQGHTPEKRVATYAGQVYRLPIRVPITGEEASRLTTFVLAEFPPGTPYDLRGALESGPRWKRWHGLLPYPDMGSIYCSALSARVLMVANRMNWDDPKLYSPGDLVRAQRRAAIHGAPQLLTRSAAQEAA